MFSTLRPVSTGSVNLNTGVSYRSLVPFQRSQDKVELSSFDRLFSETFIRKMLETNPRIKKIIQRFNPEMKLNMDELNLLAKGHLKDTQNVSKGIVENLSYGMRMKIDEQSLSDAAYLHDVGKVLIPNEVLNKPDKLNDFERKIMNLHSDISFELLKYSGLNERTLYLIKNHHNNSNGLINLFRTDKNTDWTLQILSTADKYSALLESRVYKKAMTPQEALTIIYQDVKSGNLDERIFNALVKYSQNTEIAYSSIK